MSDRVIALCHYANGAWWALEDDDPEVQRMAERQRLLIDMADHLDATRNWVIANSGDSGALDALLARFAELDRRAAQ